MPPLRVAVVGFGAVAAAHIDTFGRVADVEVTTIVSRRSQDPDALEKRFGKKLRVTKRIEDVLQDKSIDIIDICTPHPLHAEVAIAAAQAKKHVLIEKPVALSLEEVISVRDAVVAADVRACVGFECRFSMHFSLVRGLIEKGLLGKVHFGECDYFHGIGPDVPQYAWNVKRNWGGSSLLTAGCHALDGLLFFMDGAVEEVTALATRSAAQEFQPYEYPTTLAALLRFKDGRVGRVASSIDALQPYHLRVHLVGSEGAVDDRRFWTRKLPGLRKDHWSTLETALVESGDVKEHPYLPQFEAFVRAIRDGRPMERTGIDEALATHRVIAAADLSAREGRSVRLKDLPGAPKQPARPRNAGRARTGSRAAKSSRRKR
jgi:predicted dehydrogenase